MKYTLLYMLFAVVLMASVLFLPVLADEEVPDVPVEYSETPSLIIPTKTGLTDGSAEYIYVTGTGQPGIDMTAENQPVSAVVSGDVLSNYGGANIFTNENGSALLQTGNIRGEYGVWSYIFGGTVKAYTDNIFAGGDTALDILIPGSGKMVFSGSEISSSGYGVTLLTGVDYASFDFDDSDTDNDGWLDPVSEDDWDDDLTSNPFTEMDMGNNENNGNQLEDIPGSSNTEISFSSIDAGETAIDIDLNNASTVTLTAADAVFSDNTGVEIELSEAGGTVTLASPIIDAAKQGLVIRSAGGIVNVTNTDYISSYSAVDITNNGGTIILTGGGALDGNSGLFAEATGGETKAETADINAQNYGIQVWTHKAYPNFTGWSVPKIVITVDGDITDQIDMALPDMDWDIEPVPEPDMAGEPGNVSVLKDAFENEGPDEMEAEDCAGIIVDAETESSIEISVKGLISMPYGNEIRASDNSQVTVSVQEDVITDYGNRIGSYDGAEVKVAFGGGIDAGGIALDTDADSGNIDITVNKRIQVTEAGNQYIGGIFASSERSGKTNITITEGIEVVSLNDEAETSGIIVYNAGGEIKIKTGEDVTASGNGAVGMEVLHWDHGAAKPEKFETNVEITGNLTGTSDGLVFDVNEGIAGKADILVTETISGSEAGVVVSEDASPDNFDLTVWQIKSGSGHAAVTPDGTPAVDIESEIKYIIKIDPHSEDRIEVVNEDGSEPETSHGFIYQKEDRRVYVRGINGYDVTEVYNGKEDQTALNLDENNGLFYLEVPNGGAVWLSTEKFPVPLPPDDHDDIDLLWLYGVRLPDTGFSASHVTMLTARPQGLTYRPTGLTLQIPGLDTAETIVTVPEENGSYPVEWLGSAVGLLEQSSLPGMGVTVLTGHNHLNTTEAGPFLFLGSLEAGDRIMINDRQNNMSVYQVYANEKIVSDGFADIADKVHENALVLITCEDESVDGGYLNRRVILAEPM